MKKETNLPKWLGDDISYCMGQDCVHKDCQRHYCNIDWTTSKHTHWGASVSDFHLHCEDYIADKKECE